jgi:hypothetical protein
VTPEALGAIRHADRLFFLLADPLTRQWLADLVGAGENLSDAYAEGKSRHRTYDEIADRLVRAVRRGGRVVAVFYGHPGVFAYPGHEAIRRTRAEGFEARMLPGVSAEDCLFAELGVDPGAAGCQSFEATDFLLRRRRFDPSSTLLLWQIAAIGVEDARTSELWNPDGVGILTEVLRETYPARHEVVVFEARTLPIVPSRVIHTALRDLPAASVTLASTLYVPPLGERRVDRRMARRLGLD